MVKCNVIGLGYIGLPTSLILANSGHEVIGVDTNKTVLQKLKNAEAHINEPDLEELLKTSISRGRFRVQSKPSSADVFIIAVPTPLKKNQNSSIPEADISFVNKAIDSILEVLKSGDLIILESTCPVGTTQSIAKLINKINNIKDIQIAYCPERVLPGQIIKELVSNDRVIGGITRKATEICAKFYSSFCKGKLLLTDDKTAEMTKLTENSFRDVNIAFANELSMICDDLKISVDEVINYANKHPRVNILNPSSGAGGHCIPIDPWFIASKSPKFSPLIQTSRSVNKNKTNWIIEKIKLKLKSLEESIGKDPLVGIFGLTFKPNVEVLRESPALKVYKTLLNDGINVLACEPNLKESKSFKIEKQEELIAKADLLVFLVAHSNFLQIELRDHNILDFCGISK